MRARALAAVAMLAVVVSGCGGEDIDAPTASPTSTGTSLGETLIPGPSAIATKVTVGLAGAALSGKGTRLAYLTRDADSRLRVYVRNLTTEEVAPACTSATGAKADADCLQPLLSHDGSKIAFSSRATNLVPGDTNDRVDVFVKDLPTGEVTRVVQEDGTAGDRDAYLTGFSADGARVLLVSSGSLDPARPVPAGSRRTYAYVKDLAAGTVSLVSGPDSLAVSATDASGPRLSADGTRVLFLSLPDDRDYGGNGLYVRDVEAGTVVRLEDRVPLNLPSGHAVCGHSAPSADGKRVALQVCESTLDEDADLGEPPNETGVWVLDLAAGKVFHRVGTAKSTPDRFAVDPVLSADGKRLLWTRPGRHVPKLAAPMYLTNLVTGTTQRLSTAATEEKWSRILGSLSSGAGVVALEYVDRGDVYGKRTNLSGDVAVVRP